MFRTSLTRSHSLYSSSDNMPSTKAARPLAHADPSELLRSSSARGSSRRREDMHRPRRSSRTAAEIRTAPRSDSFVNKVRNALNSLTSRSVFRGLRFFAIGITSAMSISVSLAETRRHALFRFKIFRVSEGFENEHPLSVRLDVYFGSLFTPSRELCQCASWSICSVAGWMVTRDTGARNVPG